MLPLDRVRDESTGHADLPGLPALNFPQEERPHASEILSASRGNDTQDQAFS